MIWPKLGVGCVCHVTCVPTHGRARHVLAHDQHAMAHRHHRHIGVSCRVSATYQHGTARLYANQHFKPCYNNDRYMKGKVSFKCEIDLKESYDYVMCDL